MSHFSLFTSSCKILNTCVASKCRVSAKNAQKKLKTPQIWFSWGIYAICIPSGSWNLTWTLVPPLNTHVKFQKPRIFFCGLQLLLNKGYIYLSLFLYQAKHLHFNGRASFDKILVLLRKRIDYCLNFDYSMFQLAWNIIWRHNSRSNRDNSILKEVSERSLFCILYKTILRDFL